MSNFKGGSSHRLACGFPRRKFYDYLALAYLTVNKKTDEIKLFVEEIEKYDEEYKESDGIVYGEVYGDVEEIKLSKDEEAFFRKVYEEEKGKNEKTKKNIELG